MFSELLHGLLTRTQRDNGADHLPPGVSPKRPELRIGVIPGGEAIKNTVFVVESSHWQSREGNNEFYDIVWNRSH